jgi:hypothetical protein
MRDRLHVSPAFVVVAVALFVTLGGGAYAASALISGSAIKPHSIPKNRLTNSAIASLRGARGPRGYAGSQGAQGAQGSQGIQGPPGPAGSLAGTTVVSAQFVQPAGSVDIHAIACPGGTGVLSGGVTSITAGGTLYDAPFANGWAGSGDNFSGTIDGTVTIFAVCGRGLPAPSAAVAVASPWPTLEAARRNSDTLRFAK